MPPLAKLLFAAAALLAVAGLLVWGLAAWKVPLGRLPGDLRIERCGFRLYFPLGTSLLVSLLLTAAFALWAWIRGR